VRNDARGDRQFTYVPLTIPGTRPAALELSEPLGPQRAFLRRSELHVVLTLAVMVVLSGLLALGLGMAFVGRPLRALADQARRVGGGDLSHRLDVSQRDEIGDLARELNAMCDRLVEAQGRVRAEMEARITTLDQLRHADRLKTVGQLASGIAHELGTPLNVVGGRAKLILSGSLGDADVKGSARVIAEQADRMTAIIRQLLDFARRRSTRASAVDLRDVVNRTVEMVTILARARRVHMDVVLPDHALPLRADSNQLQQALANVLVNGMQAMPQGGTLHVSAGLRPGSPTQVFLVVQDDGVGIAPEHLPRLFEPFFTTKDVGEGTGLGLAVAHGIIAEHGGSIDVTSAPGRGSRFEIVLEAAGADSEHAEAV
jgi:two-component system, NtrC family, sensor kinase